MALQVIPSTTSTYGDMPAEFLSNYYCSYGWVAGSPTSYSSSTPPRNASSSNDLVVVAQSPRPAMTTGDYALLGFGALTGIAAVAMIILEIRKRVK
jgi:hypothetical protein